MTFAPYMRGLSADQIRDGIASMDDARRQKLIRRAFPGTPLPREIGSVAEALEHAGANFQVAKTPHLVRRESGELVESKRSVGLIRTDTGAEIGAASPDGYGLVQHADAFAAPQVLVERGEMSLDSCEVVDGGSKVRLSGLVGASAIEQVGKESADILAHFATFEANHSGSGCNSGSLFTLRLDCFNGMTSKELAAGFRLNHSKLAAERAVEASAALLHIREAAINEAAIMQRLALHALSISRFREIAVEVFDETRGDCDPEEDTNRKIKKRERDIEELEQLFTQGEGNVGQSYYDGYNAFTDFVTPRREALADAQAFAKRWQSANTGAGSEVKSAALRLLQTR